MAAQNTASSKLAIAYTEAEATGKVLDVSGLQADGTGTRKIPVPKTTRGTKKWVMGVPVVSDNYASYALAMQLLGPGFAPFAQEYLNLYGGQRIERVARPAQGATRPNTRLGEPIGAFPLTATMPATIPVNQVKVVTGGRGRTPRRVGAAARSPRAGTAARSPKVAKSPRVPVAVQGPDLALPPTIRAAAVRTPRGTAAVVVRSPAVPVVPVPRPVSPRGGVRVPSPTRR